MDPICQYCMHALIAQGACYGCVNACVQREFYVGPPKAQTCPPPPIPVIPMQVGSFGVGAHVKLPGPSQKEPNKYAFGTPYKEIWEDLARKDTELYTRNGLLRNCQRNMEVKLAPERFQECQDPYDVVMTFEERVMDQVIDGG